MRFSVPLLMLFLLFSNTTLAQDIRYVSGDQKVALRGGAGDDYQIVHRGVSPGVSVIVSRTSDDGLWADITTEAGDTGWIPTEKLLLEPVVSTDTPTAATAGESSDAELAEIDPTVTSAEIELADQIRIRDEQFNAIAQELYRLKRISGQAEQLDIDNRRLVENTENLRSEVEMLQAENLRLHDKVESEDFMNGALAVLLGVVIALVAPRLVPKRRKSSSWA
ncbi:MAG: TIGR04211 family SH3 domain-containing protein [Halioglobus sp.]|nr:TIGR04211 family SH3 domain-containing protein [Halioglobus sp.]